MAPSATEIARLRRLANLDETDTVYTTEVLTQYLARYAMVDADGYEPSDDDWTDTYSVYHAAVDVLTERVAAVSDTAVDFQADGASFSLSQEQRSLRQSLELCRAEADKAPLYFPS